MSLSTKPPTEVAVGIVFNQQGQALFAQRPKGKPYAGWWEFPGGKIEAGESVHAALARELEEELGLRIAASQTWVTRTHVYPHVTVRLHFCKVFSFSGEPRSLEDQAFTWCVPTAPTVSPILPAALPVLPWLALPDQLRLTREQDSLSVQELPSSLVIPASQLDLQPGRPRAQWVGASVETGTQLELANTLGCDFVLVARQFLPQLPSTTPLPMYCMKDRAQAGEALLLHSSGLSLRTLAD
jgi:8-oxo-dGTP diphosphatase